MKKWALWGCLVVVGIMLLIFNPRDLYYELRYKDDVQQFFTNTSLAKEALNISNVESIEISYVGDQFFEVKTTQGTFLVLYKNEESGYSTFSIYKQHKHIGQFGY